MNHSVTDILLAIAHAVSLSQNEIRIPTAQVPVSILYTQIIVVFLILSVPMDN
jgi:hypothetical protein